MCVMGVPFGMFDEGRHGLYPFLRVFHRLVGFLQQFAQRDQIVDAMRQMFIHHPVNKFARPFHLCSQFFNQFVRGRQHLADVITQTRTVVEIPLNEADVGMCPAVRVPGCFLVTRDFVACLVRIVYTRLRGRGVRG